MSLSKRDGVKWLVCELLLRRFKERVHEEAKSTGGNDYVYNRMDE